MNKGLYAFITLLLAASAPQLRAEEIPASTIQKQIAAFTGRVTGNKVRLRTQPSLEGYVVRETAYGELLGITGEQQDFYLVQAPTDAKGYVFRTFILDNVVEGDNINIRLFPDPDAPVIGKLSRGDKVNAVVSSVNNKWLEIDAPSSVHFFIAKEYVENCGPIEMLAQVEKRHHEATYHLSSAFHFAQSELQKSFEEIDLNCVTAKFTALTKEYSDVKDVVEKANEILKIMQDSYVQKKIAFLESRAHANEIVYNESQRAKLKEFGIQPKGPIVEEAVAANVETMSNASTTDKLPIWQTLEESIYHLWMAKHGEASMQNFYKEEELTANILTGVVEPYSRPVKNRPGDFVLKHNNLPVAFIYSTRVDLEKMIGKEITVKASSRPNNNFAFPAYFVLSVE